MLEPHYDAPNYSLCLFDMVKWLSQAKCFEGFVALFALGVKIRSLSLINYSACVDTRKTLVAIENYIRLARLGN